VQGTTTQRVLSQLLPEVERAERLAGERFARMGLATLWRRPR